MKKIAIDCRFIKSGGIGYYTRLLIDSLQKNNHLVLIGPKADIINYFPAIFINHSIVDISSSKKFCVKFRDKSNYLSKVDIFVSPSIFTPLIYPGKLIYVLYDVLQLNQIHKVSFLYRFFFFALNTFNLIRAKTVLTISEFSKREILRFFPFISKEKISMLSIPISKDWIEYSNSESRKDLEYFVLIGNIKSHKNIGLAIKAFQEIKEYPLELWIIGERKNFITSDDVVLDCLPDKIKYLGRISDDRLKEITANSLGLIFPSLYEGFGLPALEAIAVRTIPIVSDIAVFREVYSDIPFRFDPYSVEDLKERVIEVYNLSSSEREFILSKNYKLLDRYRLDDFKMKLDNIL